MAGVPGEMSLNGENACDWFAAAFDFLLKGIPTSYLVLDTETTGVDPRDPLTLPVQYGYCYVKDGEVTQAGDIVLDWTSPIWGIDQTWLRLRLLEIEAEMRAKGGVAMTYERMQAEGQDVEAALEQVALLVVEAQADGAPLVGHNFWGFDRTILLRQMYEGRLLQVVMDGDVQVDVCDVLHKLPAGVFDTGVVEKARQMGWRFFPDQTPARWYEKVAEQRRRIKWNLQDHCSRVYDLPPTEAAHDAAADCVLVHHLLQRMISIADGQHLLGIGT